MDSTPPQPSAPLPSSCPKKSKISSRFRRSRSSNPAVYCCCCPVASGVWILSLCLIIPSVALVLSLNLANLGGIIRINTPVQAKVFYSVIYSLYALIGLAIGLVLTKVAAANQRLRVLIVLYWILIVTTVVEGIYFGVMIAKNKKKFITNCIDGPLLTTTPTGTPSTLSPVAILTSNTTVPGDTGTRSGRPVNCHKTGAMIGAVYIAGPGGWIILHIAWILMVVLYAKALRRHYAADEELGTVKMAPLAAGHGHGHDLDRPFSKSGLHRSSTKQQLEDNNKKASRDIEPASGFHSHQNHPFQLDNNSRRSSSGGLAAMFKNMRPWSSSSNSLTIQDSNKNSSVNKMMHVIDEDDSAPEERGRSRTRHQGRNSNNINKSNNKSDGNDHDSSDDDDEDNNNSNKYGNQLTRLGTSSTDGSLSSRVDIPADGKGWWIRQIEGKRRGEICPCTLDPRDSRDFGPCWCGKERRISSGQTSAAAVNQIGESSSSTSIASHAQQVSRPPV
ncbi:hypothetical protein BGX29_004188 [Mortierella sp. GBA35]|nr:hypothetical protein BGX29_004188 [Mortierella sp. GBA35]